MPKLTAPLHLLQTALAAIKPYVSDDEVTPVITCVQLTAVEGGGVRLLATDRYQVGEITIPSLTLEDAPDGMLLDPIVTTYLRGITKRQLLLPGSIAEYTVTLEAPDPKAPTGPTAAEERKRARVTATLINPEGEAEQIRALYAVVGNFPPVRRLFPDHTWKPGLESIMLSPSFLANLSTTARALTGRPRGQAAVRFEFFQADGAKKDRPILVTYGEEQYGKELQTRVMIQPFIGSAR